jgi:hypothetical protein
LKFQVHIPFVEMLGFELMRFEPGRRRDRVPLREELTNSWGVAHGGVTMTCSTSSWRTRRGRRASTASPRPRASSRSR